MNIKVTKSTLPADSLIQKYLPADYVDIFAATAPENERLTPDNLLIALWTDFPKWLQWLFRLRAILVRPFGLKSGGGDDFLKQFPETIRSGGNYGFVDVPAKNDNETVMQLSDKHLTAKLSVHIALITDNQLKISINTVVHYRNLLGKVYFFIIRPFHKFIVKIIAKRGIKRLLNKK
ncbi:MAG: DUF2867 domain-containing protein [Prevotellaceae bacterium]|jgi:hypothetical protein|nr:DUF2867 domain-containing protein [Prevotellaceae bacterium]